MEFAPDAVALVAGGASGIGAAIARRLSAEGVPLTIADLDLAAATRLAGELGCEARPVDVTDPSSVAALFDGLGRAALTARPLRRRRRQARGDRDRRGDVAPEFPAQRRGIFPDRAAVRPRADRGPAARLDRADRLGAARGAGAGLAHFAAAKAASVTLVRCFANEWAASGIRVNALTPGPIDTPMTRRAWKDRSAREQADFVARIPLGRVGEPEDVASLAAFLLAQDARWITGSVFGLDGGLAVGPHGVKG